MSEVGTKVRVTRYCGGTDNKYCGLLGEVAEVYFRHNVLMVLVKLDEDPNPQLANWLGGLPCLADEIEVVDGNSASN
jgi:hypothetical protein